MAGKFHGHSRWDPLLIIYQILTVQFLSYASMSLLIFIATSISGYAPSVIFIFDYRMMRLSTGKSIIVAHLANTVVNAYLLKVFVERTKSCLDFSLTYYILHLVMVWHYCSSIPDTFIWYFINGCGAFATCIMSEFLCQREEMKSIPISAPV